MIYLLFFFKRYLSILPFSFQLSYYLAMDENHLDNNVPLIVNLKKKKFLVSDLDLIISEINVHLAVGYYHRHVLNI